ncbi:MAG: hypothetical protein ACYTG0_31460 [Planctomycetota bacterium]|jgi:hypothetical protein
MIQSTKILPMAGLAIATIAGFMFSPGAAAQSPEQILNALDADGSGTISKGEANDDLKQNFSFIDGNGDGEIDLEELDRILKLVASQNAESAPSAPEPGAAAGQDFNSDVAPAFSALTAKLEDLAASGKLSNAEALGLYRMMASAVVEEQQRYFSVLQNTVHDHQNQVHGPNVFHVVSALKLGKNVDLIDGMKEYKRVVEELGGELVYVGKTAFPGTSSKQLSESEWSVFAVLQLSNRQHWNELSAEGEYKRMLSAFDASYSLGFHRDSLENLGMPADLLGQRIQQTLTREPKLFPFQRVQSGPLASKQRDAFFEKLTADHEIFSKDAIVIVNLQKFGTAEESQANAGYSNQLRNLFAEVGHGPTHIGRAVKLDGDAEFDQVALVYYPGLQYFFDMVRSTFYMGIYGGKQLGDTLSTITVPILQLL